MQMSNSLVEGFKLLARVAAHDAAAVWGRSTLGSRLSSSCKRHALFGVR